MFSDNQKISGRQLSRQLLLGVCGILLLAMPGSTELLGWAGILGMAVGFGMVWLFLCLLIRKTAGKRSLKERTNRLVYAGMVLLYVSYFILGGAFILRLSAEMIGYSLLGDYDIRLIMLLLVLTALAGTGRDLQRRARLGEVSCVIVVVGLFLLLTAGIFQVREVDLRFWGPVTPGGILKAAYRVFCSFSIVGILPFVMHRVKRPGGVMKGLTGAVGTALFLAGGSLVVMQLLFGKNGVAAKKVPITALMASVNVPGNFLDRFDAIWMMFLMTALFYALGTALFYSQFLVNGEQSRKMVWLLAGVIFLAAMGNWKGYTAADLYPAAVQYVYMPLFVLIGLGQGKGGKKR